MELLRQEMLEEEMISGVINNEESQEEEKEEEEQVTAIPSRSKRKNKKKPLFQETNHQQQLNDLREDNNVDISMDLLKPVVSTDEEDVDWSGGNNTKNKPKGTQTKKVNSSPSYSHHRSNVDLLTVKEDDINMGNLNDEIWSKMSLED